MVWTSKDGEIEADGHAYRFHIENRNALEHLRETGVLHDLDEASRQRVIEALEAFEGEGAKKIQQKVIVLDGSGDGGEDG